MDTSTQTEKKALSPDELKDLCYQVMQIASANYQKANRQVSERLAKDGITPDEFVAYCRDREPIKTVGQ